MGNSSHPVPVGEIGRRIAGKIGRQRSRRPRAEQEIVENEFGERIIRVDGTIDPEMPVRWGDRFLFISHDQTALSHGLHKYPAKFFPELPRWLIQRYSEEGDLVLDPFAGSGTTNLEARLNRRHSVGIDVDPFSRYLARVKTTPLDPAKLEKCQRTLVEKVIGYRPSKVNGSDVPDFPYRDSWFNPEIVLELAYIRKSIAALRVEQPIRDFFLVCMSSIIRSVSNADDNCTRTVIRKRLNKNVLPSQALGRFVEVVLRNVPRMIEFSESCPDGLRADFPEGMDARAMGYPDGTFDLAVTSPPYANAVDYPRTHQLEIYWLGIASGSLAPLKKKHVGTESVAISDYRDLRTIGMDGADTVIEKIFRKDPRRAYIAYKYLEDMEQNLVEVRRVLKKGARYAVVVGNNRIRGEVFESWKYIMALGERAGFRIETMFGSEIIKHFIKVPREERINTDWVVIFREQGDGQ